MNRHAMVRRIRRVLAEENRLLRASDLGLNDQVYTKLLETMAYAELITDASPSTGLTPNGKEIYRLSKA